MANPSFNYQFRFILIGDSTVGKSSLLQFFYEGKISSTPEPTIGVDFFSRNILLADGTIIKLRLWDTAGQEKFKLVITKNALISCLDQSLVRTIATLWAQF